MALSLTQFATDFASLAADIAQTVTISGTNYAAVVSGATSAKDQRAVGYIPANGVEIHISLAVLAGVSTPPGTLITHGGTIYRVISRETDPVAAAVRLICEERQK